MDRLIGFVDFGYLKAGARKALSARVADLKPKPEGLVSWLEAQPGELLRAYWYDGAYDPRHTKHRAQRKYFDTIAAVPGIQLRLAHLRESKPSWQFAVRAAIKKCGVSVEDFEKHFEFRPQLEQKGVDTRITLDMVRLAQRHAYDVGVLIAGDRDLAEPVRVAQDEGRRIVVAVPEGAGLAVELKQLADEVVELTKADLAQMLEVTPRATDSSTSSAAPVYRSTPTSSN